MGIFQKGKNWYIDYYVKGRRKRKKIGPSKKLALQVLKDVQLKIAKGEYLGVYEEKKIPFDNYAEQYLDYSIRQIKPGQHITVKTGSALLVLRHISRTNISMRSLLK